MNSCGSSDEVGDGDDGIGDGDDGIGDGDDGISDDDGIGDGGHDGILSSNAG